MYPPPEVMFRVPRLSVLQYMCSQTSSERMRTEGWGNGSGHSGYGQTNVLDILKNN